MKKLKYFITLTLVIILTGCNSNVNIIPDYTKGQVIENTESVVKINNTTYEEYLEYIEVLRTVTFYNYNDEENKLTDGNSYIELKYIDSNSSEYDGYNVIIYKYNALPSNW